MAQAPRPGVHPLHDLPVHPKGKEADNVCNALIEIPEGSKVKYEIDKDTGLLVVDRVLYSSMEYPHNYGFIPRTLCDDGDALDILVLMQCPVPPLAIVRARPIGAMRMVDGGEQDDKIIAVCVDDPAFKHMTDITDLPPHRWTEIRSFFLDYKRGQLEEKYGQREDDTVQIVAGPDGETPRVVFNVADPFKDQPLTARRGVTVDDEKIGAKEALRILADAKQMYLDHSGSDSS